MTDVQRALNELRIEHDDDAAIAFSDRLSAARAATLAALIEQRLRESALPVAQRTWIVASSGDDAAAAKIAAAIANHSGGARLIVHDPREPDDLIFQRRIPGQRRGGVYLNAVWQSASLRIGCGQALDLVAGLSGWFNPRDQLRADDLGATLLLES